METAAVWVPALTAALTFANTIVLYIINRRTAKTHAGVNGMKWQQLAEAEARGRREGSHLRDSPLIGE